MRMFAYLELSLSAAINREPDSTAFGPPTEDDKVSAIHTQNGTLSLLFTYDVGK